LAKLGIIDSGEITKTFLTFPAAYNSATESMEILDLPDPGSVNRNAFLRDYKNSVDVN
jgi:hypothetical protein